MANKQQLERQFAITSADTYIVGDVGTDAYGILAMHLKGNLWNGSITVKARVTGSNFPFVAIPYRKLYLNAAVADATIVSTAITGDSVIQVENAAGLDVALDVTTYTGGKMSVALGRAGT